MAYPEMRTTVPWSLVKSGFHKSPRFNSLVQTPAANRGRSSISLQPFGSWDFELDLNLVQGGEAVQNSVLQQFLGTFLATRGRGGFFLFTDPNDNAVEWPDGTDDTDQSLLIATPNGALQEAQITGDGTTTQFQLARIVDQGIDIIQQASNVTVFVSGNLANPTVDNLGVVTFDSPPPAGAVLSWQGSFRYLCQFTDDTLKDLARVSKNSGGWLWSCSSVAFESVFL